MVDSDKTNKESMLIESEKIKEVFDTLVRENMLSTTFSENPKMFFINLPAGFKGDEEMHEDEDDLYLVVSESADLIVDSTKKIKINKGDMIHIPAKQVHKLEFTEKGVQYIVVKMKA